MVAAHHQGAVGAHPFDHRVGVGAITYQVAAAEGALVEAFGLADNGLEGFPVGVQVAEDDIAHRAADLCLSQS